MGIKGDVGIPGDPGPVGPKGPPGMKGEPGQSISAPSLLQRPFDTTVNESNTAILKCTADGNPRPKLRWTKLNSSLSARSHMVESSGALILKDIRPGDEGVYSCRAENLLGKVNASAKLTVQCKLHGCSIKTGSLGTYENLLIVHSQLILNTIFQISSPRKEIFFIA